MAFGLWDYLVEHPEEAVIFDRAMTDGSRGVVEAIVSAYNFSAFSHVVDIGGGQGAMIAAILAAHTNTHGILFDRPDVVARAQPVLEAAGFARRCAVVGGSFFETIPEGGDAYLLKYNLHDWGDAAALAILAACRQVCRPEGRLLIMERIVGGPNDGLETKTSDLNIRSAPPEYNRLQPQRLRTFKRSQDAAFAKKVEDVVGLFMEPPCHAVVLSIDEKSQIQALDRTQPGLPLKPGNAPP